MFGKRKNSIGQVVESEFYCRREPFTVRGKEFRPKGDRLPIAIVSHQFMASMNTVEKYARILADMGYVSFCFDFCGGGLKSKSEGKTTEMSVETEIKDLEAVIGYAKSRAYTSTDDIVLVGCSQGGLVSAITAGRHNSEISKLVLFYPALCVPDDVRAGRITIVKFDPDNVPDIIRCGPMKLGRCYVDDVVNMDVTEEIKKFSGDVMIVHGTKDKIVDISYSKNADRTYKERKSTEEIPVGRSEFYIIENGAHGFRGKRDDIAIAHMKSFLTTT